MPLTLSPLQETDIPDSVQIELEAFRSHPRIPMMWPRGYTPDLYEYYEEGKRKKFHDASTKLMKAVDSETGKTVAISEWTFALDPEKQTTKQPVDDNPPPNWPVGGNWEMRKFYKLNLERWMKDYVGGKPYIRLDILVTNPEFHRRGAGTKLLSWGTEEADRNGAILCLEATPAGLELYKRHDFREVDEIKADMKQFGWHEPYDEEAAKRVWMLREPQTLSS